MSDPYDDTQVSLDQKIFWSSEFGWPEIDPDGLVFLARAVQLTGETMFPGEWDGDEPWTPWAMSALKPEKGGYYSWQRWQLDEARRSLVNRLSSRKSPEERGEIERRFHYDGAMDVLDYAIEKATGWPDGDASYAFDDEAWAMIADLSAKTYARDTKRRTRLGKVKSAIAQAILGNKFTFTAIPLYGGRWIPCDRESWCVTRWDEYFKFCNISIPGDNSTYQIFLDDAGFYKFLRSIGKPESNESAWRPNEGETTKAWCVRPAVAREADDRAKKVFGKNPQEQQRAQALASMWEEATGLSVKASSIVTYLSSARAEKKEAKPINQKDTKEATS